MIYYPLQTLIDAGLDDILIVSGRGHAGHFLELLGSGSQWGVSFTYEIQDEAGGIAQALSLGEGFVEGEDVAVILGDNIFQDNVSEDVSGFTGGGRIFLKEVPEAERFGVAELDGDRVIGIEEKPEVPKSDYAVTGLYMYDFEVFDVVRRLTPSGRGELEITDVNNYYIGEGVMRYRVLDGGWSDAGTFGSLLWAGWMVEKYREENAYR